MNAGTPLAVDKMVSEICRAQVSHTSARGGGRGAKTRRGLGVELRGGAFNFWRMVALLQINKYVNNYLTTTKKIVKSEIISRVHCD